MNQPETSCQEIVRRLSPPVAAVVFCGETYNGLALTRALGRQGIPVYALGQEQDSICFYSRYTCESVVYPDPVDDEEGFVRVVLGLGARIQRDGQRAVLVPAGDRVLKLLSRHRAQLGEYFITHLPAPDVLDRCLDKQAQCEVARQLGIPTPRTYLELELPRLVGDLEAGRLAFPLLFKARQALPAYSLNRMYRRTVLLDSGQLHQLLSEAARERILFAIQEIIPGGDDELYTLGSSLDRHGQLKAVFTGRKLRQNPPGFGICRVGESKQVEEIVRDGTRLLRALGFFGTSQVEFKRDFRDGKYKLLEVNPRSWSWIGLPIEMGINIPFATFCDCLGIDTPVQPMTPKRALWISLSDDFETSLVYRDGLPWRHGLSRYDQVVEAYFSRDDPKPGLIHFQRTLADYAARATRRAARLLGWHRPKTPP